MQNTPTVKRATIARITVPCDDGNIYTLNLVTHGEKPWIVLKWHQLRGGKPRRMVCLAGHRYRKIGLLNAAFFLSETLPSILLDELLPANIPREYLVLEVPRVAAH